MDLRTETLNASQIIMFFKRKRSDLGELNIVPTEGGLGVQLSGIGDITKMSDDLIEKLKSIILKEGLVVIKTSKEWGEEAQVKLTNYLGKIELPVVHSTTTPSHPEIKELWPYATAKASGLQWHSDRSFNSRPSHLSIFQMIRAPKSGNVTSFVSLTESYKQLPFARIKEWEKYKVIYTRDNVMHPILWTHPISGEKTIYFDFGFASEITHEWDPEVHLDIKNFNQIMEELLKLFSNQKACYDHQWEKGDIIIADNYAVAHKANLSPDNKELRVLLRTTTEGIYF